MRRKIRQIPDRPLFDDSSLLQQLGRDYKAFKALHPERTARIPAELKDMAKSAAEGGATVAQISEVTGLGAQSITRWLESIVNPKPRKKRGEQAPVVKTGAAPLVSEKSSAVVPSARVAQAAADDEQWVKIRVDGKVIEVARKDFWDLIRD